MPDEPGPSLDPDGAVEYLRSRGVIPSGVEAVGTRLGGGVSNHVLQVRWGSDCVVLKQPLENLAVEDDWPADVERVHNEAAAARAYASVIETTGIAARVPAVRIESEPDHVIGLECAPDRAVMWKAELLAGQVDVDVAGRLGELLGEVHATVADDADLRATFRSKRPFEQLRLDPYHRTTADRHPEVAGAIREETERVRGVERTLVHGDYSPKNVLIEREPETVPWILDFEVAHWGDPAFDVAFMLNHLFIKSVYNHTSHESYLRAARAFWGRYRERVPWDLEPAVVAELGVLMLARVDGKSPVEYVDDDRISDALRTIAKTTLRERLSTVEGFVEVIALEVDSL